MEQISLYFGTPISKSIIKSDLEEYVMDMSKSDEGVQISNRGGWQSKPFFKPEKEFELLWAEIEEKINMYHHTIELKGGVRISDLWFNVNYRGSANRQHQHANSIHSGVYYIKTPENCGRICFTHPSSSLAWSWSPSMVERYNAFNTNTVTVNPEKNLLLVFPSWTDHSVDPNLSDDIRISLSFNTGLIQ
tara:strand:- start:190 stop:759 length:570 start_codon:yes stop_codon:yes gene_type:complete